MEILGQIFVSDYPHFNINIWVGWISVFVFFFVRNLWIAKNVSNIYVKFKCINETPLHLKFSNIKLSFLSWITRNLQRTKSEIHI